MKRILKGAWLLTERRKARRKRRREQVPWAEEGNMSSARQPKDQSSVAVYPVRRQCPRFQASGYTIHIMQSWSRPGSSRIPRLGGRANGALGNPTDNHCNPITRKAPHLLQRRTAGSPCRDKITPIPMHYSCTADSRNLRGKGDGKKRKKEKKKVAGRWDSKLRWERGDPEERWDRQIRFWLCVSSWGTYIKLQLVLVSDVNRSCGQLDELNFPVWWFILKLVLYSIHQVHLSVWRGICNVHDSPLEFLTFLIPNRAGLQEMILIVDNRPTIMFLIQLMKYWTLK